MSPFKSCYSFDGKLNHIGDSNSVHPFGGLAKYKKYLITIGSIRSIGSIRDTELMQRVKNGTFIWSAVDSPDLYKSDDVYNLPTYMYNLPAHYTLSLVNIPPSDINEEYVIHIGGLQKILDGKYSYIMPFYMFINSMVHGLFLES